MYISQNSELIAPPSLKILKTRDEEDVVKRLLLLLLECLPSLSAELNQNT